MPLLQNRVALVNGAGSGIGQGVALRFAQEGARLALFDIRQASLDETADKLKETGADFECFSGDVSLTEDVARFFDGAVKRFGRIDICVNNAGIGNPPLPLVQMTDEGFDRTIAVNLRGVFLCMRAAGRQMIAQGGGGRIISVSSQAGKSGFAMLAPYCATKAGVILMTRDGEGGWADGHHGELRLSGHHRYAAASRYSGSAARSDRSDTGGVGAEERPAYTAGTHRLPGGCGQADHLPRFRRGRLHDGPGDQHLRRPGDALSAECLVACHSERRFLTVGLSNLREGILWEAAGDPCPAVEGSPIERFSPPYPTGCLRLEISSRYTLETALSMTSDRLIG